MSGISIYLDTGPIPDSHLDPSFHNRIREAAEDAAQRLEDLTDTPADADAVLALGLMMLATAPDQGRAEEISSLLPKSSALSDE